MCERYRRPQRLWLFLWLSGSHGKFGTEERYDLTGSNRIPPTDPGEETTGGEVRSHEICEEDTAIVQVRDIDSLHQGG